MRRTTLPLVTLTLALTLTAGAALGGPRTLKVDRFDDDPETAASQIEAASSLECLPGFLKGEGYGVILVPNADDYPFDLLSIDLVQGDTGSAESTNDVTIEVYNDDGIAAAPSGPAIFTRTSASIFVPPNQTGLPVEENTFMRYQFDPTQTEPGAHPPTITSGNLRIVIQFDEDAKDLSAVDPGCAAGCQDPCALTDDDGVTPQRTVIHAAGDQWAFSEDFSVQNDWILRAVIDSSAVGDGGGGGAGGASATAGAGGATAGAGGDGATTTSASASSTAGAGGDAAGGESAEGGCGCHVGSRAGGGAGLFAALGLGLLALRRRDRRQ